MTAAGNGPLRVGIIGSGGMAAARAERIRAHPDVILVAIMGRNRETRAELAERFGVTLIADSLRLLAMDDLDAVFIATHPDTHATLALAALERGKHVFSESTLALAVEDADGIVQTAHAARLVVRVGHTSVLRPAARLVAEQVERLGGPLLDEVRIQFPNDERGGRVAGFDPRISGHPVLAAVMLGYPCIHGRGPIRSIRAWTRLTGVEPQFDTCVARVEVAFRSGVVAGIAYLRGFPWGGPGWRTVACRQGAVRVEDGAAHLQVLTEQGAESVPIPDADPWAQEIDEFVHAIRDGAPMSVTLDDARRIVAIAEAAQDSSDTGETRMGEP
jgi:biliverdin reductase